MGKDARNMSLLCSEAFDKLCGHCSLFVLLFAGSKNCGTCVKGSKSKVMYRF